MADTRRFYWLKLKEDFFRQKEIKKLRKIAGGDVYTIIYLKMLLRAMRDGGKLYFEGVEDNFASELALDIDEGEDNVKMTVAFLMANGILVQNQPDEYELLTINEMTGSEGESAHRMRKMRAQKAIEGVTSTAQSDGTASQSDGQASHSDAAVTTSDVEIEIEIEKEKEREYKRENAHRFTPPTLDEVKAYATEKGYTQYEFSPNGFIDFYQSKGWIVGRNKMKDWKAAVRGWVSRYRQEHPEVQQDHAEQPKRWQDLPPEEQRQMEDRLADEYWASRGKK